MDRFVIKEAKKKKDPHLAVNITARDRANQYPGVFHVDNGLLFCSTCNVVVDHVRKCVLEKHLESSTHKKKFDQVTTSSGKQRTLKTAFECKTKPQVEKVKVCEEWIKVCAAANIPLHKSDNPIMRNFLNNRVVNGGAIPKASQLRDYYLFDVYQIEKAELKNRVKGKKVALIADELCDRDGRYVLDIMAVLLDFDDLSPCGKTVAYLLDSHFLSATNNKTVSQAMVRTVTDYDIDFNDVLVFNSDNVGYMKKAFNDTLSCLFPLCVHITCHSHIVNLVASDFKRNFKEVNEFVKCFRNLFFIPSGRKSRFVSFLQSALNKEDGVRMPPNPNTKCWSVWFESVLYHADYYSLLEGFIKEELDQVRNVACTSLLRLEEMYSDNSFMKKLGAQLRFLKVKSPTLKIYMDYFQQKVPHVIDAYGKMENLMYYLEQNTHLSEEHLDFCFEGDDFSCEERNELVLLANSAFTAAHEKLQKYVVAGSQPALKFLEQVRVFDPRNLVTSDTAFDAIDSIPGFDNVCRNEWDLYGKRLGPDAVKRSRDGQLDLVLFWKSNEADLPELYKLASCYCTATTGSYDVERAFSAYDDILNEKRLSLDRSTIKAFHFLNWNLRVLFSEEQKKDRPIATPSVPVLHTRVPQATPKQADQEKIPKDIPKVSTEPMQQTHATTKQLTDDLEMTKERQKGTKRKNCEKDVRKIAHSGKAKKKKESSGRAFRASLNTVIGRTSSAALPAKCNVEYGLDHEISTVFATVDTCTFPHYKEPLINFLVDETASFKGSKLIDRKDLLGLIGGNTRDEENYLSNFIVDEYLEVLVTEANSQGLKADTIGWVTFEKMVGVKAANYVLKGKAPLLEQDIVLVPLNPGQSKHWSLLVAEPKEKKIFVLDSLAAAYVKPCTKNAITKMWNLLQETDAGLDPKEWQFFTNTPEDIPQQPNSYDCGAFVCAYARCLLLKCSLPDSFSSFRKHLVLELHHRKIQAFEVFPLPQQGKYYAIEYQKAFYIGRALTKSEGFQTEYKFLHTSGAKVFDWPKRDDVETCHDSCAFYGPVSVLGNAPFTIPQLTEIELVFSWRRKSRKARN